MAALDEQGVYTAPLIQPANSITLASSLADAPDNPGALSASTTIKVVNPVPVVTQLSPHCNSIGKRRQRSPGIGFNPTSKVTVKDLVAGYFLCKLDTFDGRAKARHSC